MSLKVFLIEQLRVHLRIQLQVHINTYKCALWDLNKDAQEGVFEVALKYVRHLSSDFLSTCQCTAVHRMINEKVNLRKCLRLNLKAHLIFHIREHLKMHKKMKKKMHLMLQLMLHLTVQSRLRFKKRWNWGLTLCSTWRCTKISESTLKCTKA